MMETWFGKPRDAWRTSKVWTTLFYFGFLDISLSSIDGYYHDIVDKILSNVFIFESYESKTSRLPRINIF